MWTRECAEPHNFKVGSEPLKFIAFTRFRLRDLLAREVHEKRVSLGAKRTPPKVVSRAAERSGECASKRNHAPAGCTHMHMHTCAFRRACTHMRTQMCVPDSAHTCVCTRRVHEIHAPEGCTKKHARTLRVPRPKQSEVTKT